MLFESKDTASKEDTQSQQQMPGQQTGMYAGYANGTSIDDDQDEMPRISLSSTATATNSNSATATGMVVVNAINNCNSNPINTTSAPNERSSGGNPITASLSNIGSAVNSSSNNGNGNSNNTTSSRRSVR